MRALSDARVAARAANQSLIVGCTGKRRRFFVYNRDTIMRGINNTCSVGGSDFFD